MKNQIDFNQQLSEHFTLKEMLLSGTAIRLGIVNRPTQADVERLRALCLNVLEPLRREFGIIRVTSGFRTECLNYVVGGRPESQHTLGEAADLHLSTPERGERMYQFALQNLDFDQMLLEHKIITDARWLHISYVAQPGRRPNRHDARQVKV